MGFRTGAIATVWEVNQKRNTVTEVRISISRKKKDGTGWEQDFSGYVAFVGTAAASKAAKLHEKDRIRLGDVDVTTTYNKEKKITYTNYACFSFEDADAQTEHKSIDERAKEHDAKAAKDVDSGEVLSDGELPF